MEAMFRFVGFVCEQGAGKSEVLGTTRWGPEGQVRYFIRAVDCSNGTPIRVELDAAQVQQLAGLLAGAASVMEGAEG